MTPEERKRYQPRPKPASTKKPRKR
jgi:hypothetical protein